MQDIHYALIALLYRQRILIYLDQVHVTILSSCGIYEKPVESVYKRSLVMNLMSMQWISSQMDKPLDQGVMMEHADCLICEQQAI